MVASFSSISFKPLRLKFLMSRDQVASLQPDCIQRSNCARANFTIPMTRSNDPMHDLVHVFSMFAMHAHLYAIRSRRIFVPGEVNSSVEQCLIFPGYGLLLACELLRVGISGNISRSPSLNLCFFVCGPHRCAVSDVIQRCRTWFVGQITSPESFSD